MDKKLDYDRDQPAILAINDNERRKRAMITLQAFAHAVAFDGILHDTEIEMLTGFLLDQAEFRDQWPLVSVWEQLNLMLADGAVSLEERANFLRHLKQIAAHDPDRPQKAADSIFDDVDVVIAGRSFVMTGVLEYSKRSPFEARLASVGAIIHDNVRMDTSFVVVGLKGSAAWTTDRYGTKIDKAMQLKRDPRGCPIKIVKEADAIEALLAAEAARK